MKSPISNLIFVPLCVIASLASLVRAQPNPEKAPSISVADLIDDISASNPELKFYEAEIAAAKAGRRSAAAWNDPELSLQGGRKRVRDANGMLAGEGTAWSVSIMQTFEWPGRLDLRKAIANREVQLAEIGLDRFKRALAARARVLSYGLYAANSKVSAIREVADRFTALKETFLSREPGGITPLLETRVIEATELNLQRRAADAELSLQGALIELNQMRGVALNTPLRVAAEELKLADAPSVEALLNAAGENNFEFRMRRVELEQQGYQVRLARNERYPAISVGPNFSRENAGDHETVVGLSLSLPLPLTNRTRGAVDLAEARRKQAEVAVVVAQRTLEREVMTAAQVFTIKLGETRRWAPDALNKFREAADLADRHYRLGAVPIATYVELQNSYLEAVEVLLETQREVLEAGLKLQELTGLELNHTEIQP
jgi:cobalt-zinc-cadmium efflux system outer membrane protein